MNRKAKGTGAEREIVKLFWDSNWAALRTPASGAARYPNPDIIASNKERTIAIECKATASSGKFFNETDLSGLRDFSARFGAEPWVGVRFDREGWYFISLENINKTKSGYSITFRQAKLLGLSFQEMIQ